MPTRSRRRGPAASTARTRRARATTPSCATSTAANEIGVRQARLVPLAELRRAAQRNHVQALHRQRHGCGLGELPQPRQDRQRRRGRGPRRWPWRTSATSGIAGRDRAVERQAPGQRHEPCEPASATNIDEPGDGSERVGRRRRRRSCLVRRARSRRAPRASARTRPARARERARGDRRRYGACP